MSKQSQFIESWNYQINRLDYIAPDSIADYRRIMEIKEELREIVKRASKIPIQTAQDQREGHNST